MSFLGKEYPSHLLTCCSSPSHSHLSLLSQFACALVDTLCCNIEPINTCTHVCIVLYLVFAAVYYLFVYTLMHRSTHNTHHDNDDAPTTHHINPQVFSFRSPPRFFLPCKKISPDNRRRKAPKQAPSLHQVLLQP